MVLGVNVMAPPLTDDPLVGQNVGGYLVEAPLGEGGMGLVFRARHPVLNRYFAIKVLRPELAADAASAANFLREAQTLSSLKHPSIIDIIGFGPLSDGRHYMVMEYLVGRTLERELADEGRLTPERALELSDEILDALSAAHSVDVIHRDLKPSNVFLAKVSGGREVVKLLDFGLARQQPQAALGAHLVAAVGASVIAGTPEYIAPEQAIGRAASKQSDLYSFGVMLFEMLTGSRPFSADAAAPQSQRILNLMTKQVYQAPPTLQSAAGGVIFPAGLAEIVADLLKKTPGERPSSAETVRKRLHQAHRSLQQEATQSRPNPLLEEGPKPSHPRRKSSAPLLAGAALLLLLPAGAWWWLSREPPVPQLAAAIPTAPVPDAPVPDAPVPPPLQVAPAPAEVEPPPEAEPLDELTGLRSIKARKLKPIAPGCAPDAEWKKRARAELNELATRASTLNPGITLWAAEREGPLSAAIEAATSADDCRAVGHQLAKFKDKVKAP